MIEARIGELFDKAPSAHKSTRQDVRVGPTKKDLAPVQDFGMRKNFEKARAIHRHPDAVAEVIKEAEENEDIPTKTAVLNKIAYKKELERKKETREKNEIEMAGDAYLYLSRLQDALSLIPLTPPKELRERDFLLIKAVWMRIYEKGKEFLNGTQSENPARTSKRLPSRER